ncbi:MAG: hypothetical protein KF767_18930 [Bdellovibrionaceae bacterium]|nr:hypothetical protein [Pseudobdellovibrionaceae bacterium]
MMKIAIVLVTMILGIAQAQACVSCNEIAKTTKEFGALNPRSTVDQETGGKLIDPMMKTIRAGVNEAAKNSKLRTRLWSDLFAMVTAAGPYDFESQGAQLLHEGLRRDAKAAAQFDKEFSGNKLSCEKKLLKSAIVEFRCNDRRSGGKVPAEGGVAACVQTFNYDLCK